MTEQQLYFFSGLALAISVAAALLTRATLRRIVGAVAGAGATGVALLAVVSLGERVRVWHMAIDWRPYMVVLLLLSCALCAYVFLITWRIARRFGWRGLAIVGFGVAIIGPPRDYWYMSRFPEWGYYAPGFGPVIAISVAYVTLIFVGHGVMRLVAGPCSKRSAGSQTLGSSSQQVTMSTGRYLLKPFRSMTGSLSFCRTDLPESFQSPVGRQYIHRSRISDGRAAYSRPNEYQPANRTS